MFDLSTTTVNEQETVVAVFDAEERPKLLELVGEAWGEDDKLYHGIELSAPCSDGTFRVTIEAAPAFADMIEDRYPDQAKKTRETRERISA